MKAYIYCAGAQGRVVLDILRQCGTYEQARFVDDDRRLWGAEINGALVAGGPDCLLREDAEEFRLILAAGDPRLREQLAVKARQHDFPLLNAIHPSAVIMPSCRLGQGDTICAGAVVNTDARIGDHVIVNTAAVVEHDCDLGGFATVGPGVQLGGRSTVGRGAFLCTGAIVLPRIAVGAGSVVAAGAVVTRPVPPRVLVMGVPARVRSEIDESFDWHRLL